MMDGVSTERLESEDPLVRRVTYGFRVVVGLVGAATWLLIPLISLRSNLRLDARGQLTSGDPTRYLFTNFVLGLFLAGVVMSSYVAYLVMIRDPGVTLTTGLSCSS
jgi:hypothetical protein